MFTASHEVADRTESSPTRQESSQPALGIADDPPEVKELYDSETEPDFAFIQVYHALDKCISTEALIPNKTNKGYLQERRCWPFRLRKAPSVVEEVTQLQTATSALSWCFFLPGVVFLATTVFCVIPIFVFPAGDSSKMMLAMIVGSVMATILITLGVITANVQWYQHEKNKTVRCRLHYI